MAMPKSNRPGEWIWHTGIDCRRARSSIKGNLPGSPRENGSSAVSGYASLPVFANTVEDELEQSRLERQSQFVAPVVPSPPAHPALSSGGTVPAIRFVVDRRQRWAQRFTAPGNVAQWRHPLGANAQLAISPATAWTTWPASIVPPASGGLPPPVETRCLCVHLAGGRIKRVIDVFVGDFNGDGIADLAGRDPNTRRWRVALSDGNAFHGAEWGRFEKDGPWKFVQVGDFNGDGKADIATWNAATGEWVVGFPRATTSMFKRGAGGGVGRLANRRRRRFQRRRQNRLGRFRCENR